jgi:hypothetical protein
MENIFVTIAKQLAQRLIKKDLTERFKKLEEDPQIQASQKAMKYYQEELDKLLPEFCKRRPNSPMCKEYFEKNKDKK